MDDKNKATQAILRKKPFGLRFKPVEVSYLISYKNLEGITYLSYIRNNIRFKCDWKRKLFSTNYTILSEMVVTDRKETILQLFHIKQHSNKIMYSQTKWITLPVTTFGEAIIS